MPSRTARHHVSVVVDDPQWNHIPAFETLAHQSINATLDACDGNIPASEVHLLATSDAVITDLNEQFRDRHEATNVLSWPVSDMVFPDEPADNNPLRFIGDIAIAFDFCQNEATLTGVRLEHHLCHLLVHGCLHLIGYTHDNETSAQMMERLEIQILSSLGVPNPYEYLLADQ